MTEPIFDQDSDLQDILNKLYELYDDTSFTTREDLPGKTTKLMDCPHEIVFKITASVLEEDKEGQLVSSKEVCTKDYHIPVPIDKDYKEYMKIFFNFLENGLASSADKIYNQEPGNEKTKTKRSKRKSK